ncbi:MAG: hypothetical protein ACOX31_03180, partial [Eubacteriales bacterium]
IIERRYANGENSNQASSHTHCIFVSPADHNITNVIKSKTNTLGSVLKATSNIYQTKISNLINEITKVRN